MKATYHCLLAVLFFCGITCAHADEQGGLSVLVTRKTTDRSLTRESALDTTKLKQGLRVEVKNIRLKPFPAGELRWTILVHKRASGLERHQGSEPLKALKTTEVAELMVGDFGVSSIRGYDGITKDKLEYQLVVLHDGKESYRFATAPNFASLAKDSTLARRRGEEEAAPPQVAEVEPKRVAEPEKKGMPLPPAVPKVMPPTSPTPPVEPAEPVRPPVDFFNLGGK